MFAFVELQYKVELFPEVIDVGSAINVAVGFDAGGVQVFVLKEIIDPAAVPFTL
jgi:hypothetical protein